LPLQQAQSVTLTNWPAGRFYGEWYDPATASPRGLTQAVATNGTLTLPLPAFTEDLAGLVYPPPQFSYATISSSADVRLIFNSETGGKYFLEMSPDLSNWTTLLTLTNVLGTTNLILPGAATNAAAFFRARR
jgi:hypothetical protein